MVKDLQVRIINTKNRHCETFFGEAIYKKLRLLRHPKTDGFLVMT